MTPETVTYSAWREPWVSVSRKGVPDVVSLRELFLSAHELDGLGPGLTPLDRDSLLRFLVSLTALLGRVTRDWSREDLDRFDTAAVEAFESQFEERFALTGERPFLQRWDHPQHRLVDLVRAADDKPVKGVLPIEQLHPHTPGASSSKWALRTTTREAGDPATATQLLVTAWFQTKNGNGQDPFGGRASKGSSGTWHTNPMAVWWSDPSSLGRTLWANTPTAWVDEKDLAIDLPVFLDHHSGGWAPEFADQPTESVARFTYAKSLPLLVPTAHGFEAFILGPDGTIPMPPASLGKDDKERLGRVHELDHTRLYVEKTNAKGVVTELAPRGSFGTTLSSTEGFTHWFRADRGIEKAMATWKQVPRILEIDDADATSWDVALFSETTDGKGSRVWAAWDSLPALFVGAQGEVWNNVRLLLDFASQCRRAFLPAGRTATGESKEAPAIESGQAAFYTQILPILTEVAGAIAGGESPELRAYASQIASVARRNFETTTDPLLTPRQVTQVAKARAEYVRRVSAALNESYPILNQSEEPA